MWNCSLTVFWEVGCELCQRSVVLNESWCHPVYLEIPVNWLFFFLAWWAVLFKFSDTNHHYLIDHQLGHLFLLNKFTVWFVRITVYTCHGFVTGERERERKNKFGLWSNIITTIMSFTIGVVTDTVNIALFTLTTNQKKKIHPFHHPVAGTNFFCSLVTNQCVVEQYKLVPLFTLSLYSCFVGLTYPHNTAKGDIFSVVHSAHLV